MKVYITALLLALGCAALFAFNLGDLSLLKGDENYYFSSARRMVREGDFVTPRYHNRIRFEKPILYYWLVALFIKLFGANWAAARATSVFFATGTVLLTYLMSLRLLKERKAAYIAPVILATSFLFFNYSRIAVLDATFLFFVTLGFYLFLKAEAGKNRVYFFLSCASLGLSVMVKGPLGLIIAFITIFAYIAVGKRHYFLKGSWLLAGVLIILAISLPWPYMMYKIYGHEYAGHLWQNELVDKSIGSIAHIKNAVDIPLFTVKYLGYYIPVVLFSFAPWSLFLPFGFFKKSGSKNHSGRVFILSWFWSVFIFFSLMSFKHTHYMLLLSPAMAMITADLFTDPRFKKTFNVIAAGTVIVYISLAGFILPGLNDGTLKDFSLALTSQLERPGEKVGIASRGFNLKKLGIYLNNLAPTAYEPSGDDLARYESSKGSRLVPFLTADERVFCLITKKDYENLVPKDLRGRLYILDKSFMWRKFDLREYAAAIMKKDFNGLKEETYLISNKRKG